MEDELRPVIERSHKDQNQRIKAPRSQDVLSNIVRILSAVIGLLAIAVSLWEFAGFTENDGGLLHLLSAAGLSFAIGGLFYIPAFWIAFLANGVVRSPGAPRPVWRPILLILPWFPLALYLFLLGRLWVLLSVILTLYALLILYWATRNARGSRG